MISLNRREAERSADERSAYAADSIPTDGRPGTARVVCVLVFALTPAVLFAPDEVTTAYLAAVATTVLAALLLGGALSTSPFAPGRAIFLVFVLVWYGLSPMASIANETFPGGAEYTTRTIIEVLIVTLLGLLAFEIGHLSGRPRQLVESSSIDMARWRSAALLLVSLAAWYRLGGLDLTFATRTEAASSLAAVDAAGNRNLNRAGSSILLAIARVPPAYLLVAHLLRSGQHRSTSGSPLSRRVWMAALIVCNSLVSSPLSTPRQWVGGVVIASLMAAFASQRSQRLIVAGLVPALLFAFPLANIFRSEVSSATDLTIDSPETSLTERFDFDVFATTADALTKVEASGHTLGSQVLGPPLFWVPRSLWEGKPVYSGLIIFDESPTNASPHDNMSVSLWAEGFLDFGLVGTAAVLFGYGWFIKRTEGWLDGRHTDWRTARSLLLIGFSLVVIRGPLLPAASTIAAIFFVAWFAGHRFEQATAPDHWQYRGADAA